MKVIKANLKVPPIILFLTWTLLVLAPYICFRLTLDVFFTNEFQQNVIRIEPILYTEFQHFSEDLDERVMLKKKFFDFDEKHGFKDYEGKIPEDKLKLFGKLSAESMRNNLERSLQIPVLAVFSYSTDTEKVDFSVNSKAQTDLKAPSRTMMKRLFTILNDQKNCDVLYPDAFKQAFPGSFDLTDETIRKNYSDNFLQKFFGLIYSLTIKRGQLTEVAAAKIGKTGNVFLYYSNARLKKSGRTYNAGGYLAAVRLQDIPEQQIVNFALSRKFYPQLCRKTGELKTGLRVPDNYKNADLSQFRLFPDRYSISGIIPQVAIVRKIQKGTILPVDFSCFTDKTASMEVSIPLSNLQHPLKKHEKSIFLCLNLLLLFATTIFLRLWLYGLDFKASISIKIAIATVLTCLIPVGGFYSLSLVYQQNERTSINENLKKHLNSRAFSIQRLINEKMNSFQHKTQLLAARLEKLGVYKEEILKSIFEKWCRENSANGVIFQKLDEKFFNYYLPELNSDPDFRKTIEIKKAFFCSLIEFLLSSPRISINPDIYSNFLTTGTNNSESVHQLLTSNGKLIYMARISSTSLNSGILINSWKDGKKYPLALLGIEYSISRILEIIYREAFKNFQFSEKLHDFNIDMAIARFDGEKFELVKQCTSPSLDPDKTLSSITNCSKVKKKLLWNHTEGNKEYFSMIQFPPQFPYALFIQGSRFLDARSDLFDTSFWLFPVLIIITTLLLSAIFFTTPAIKFSQGLSEIAQGNLDYKLKLKTSDEFEKLSNEFNLMTKSLKEKEQLEKFVSPDVLEEIHRHTESEMTPGGEKIDVTVLFSTFRAISQRSFNGTPEKAVAEIDAFLSVCNAICSQNHGVIDKIIGKTMMMVFRGSFNHEDHRTRACNSAIQIHETMAGGETTEFICSSGISSGSVVSGKIGSTSGKLDFTIIGDTVNLAARLKSMAEKGERSKIICSESMQIQNMDFRYIELEPVEIKGKKGLVKTFELSIS